jgi:predicted dehydrogenase
MRKLRWGVLGAANIALAKVIPAMQRGRLTEVVALASRSMQRAQEAAGRLGIPRAYGSYEALLADAEVEAVYIPLPNHLHVSWSIKALEAGKHVLCEKPLAMSVQEAETLVAAGRRHAHLKLMEAFMYRHHPQWVKTAQLVREGRVGQLRTIHSFFSYFNRDPANVRNQAEIGGGGLLDIGCYCVSLARFLCGREPIRVVALMDFDPDFRTDRLASGLLDFGDVTSTFTCGTQLTPYQRVQVFGTQGRIEIEIPFNAPPDRPCCMWHHTETELNMIELAVCDQYTIQGDLFSQAVLSDTPVPTPIEDAVANLRVIEALFRSHTAGGWVNVG